MWLPACVFVGSLHFAWSVFFHELSPIELVPDDGKETSSFGFSLGYQDGPQPNLVIGAPRYDEFGRVYQRSIADIQHGQKTCKHIDIDFDKLEVLYSRNLSSHQHFYLGASIAATEDFFLTCAPLRTSFASNIENSNRSDFGAYGVCFDYSSEGVRKYDSYGLEKRLQSDLGPSEQIYGGSGWSTLVDKDRDRIVISKSFGDGDLSLTSISNSHEYFWSLFEEGQNSNEDIFSKIGYFAQGMTFGNYFHAEKTTTYLAVSMKQLDATSTIKFFHSGTLSKIEWDLKDDTVGAMFGVALCSVDVTRDGLDELVVGAPAHVADTRSYDKGALHIYTKSETPSILKMLAKLTILGENDGARFGTTLASNDVDGDSYPEIFVSAPYEDAGIGALYVLCGYELHTTIVRGRSSVFVSDLQRKQRIVAAAQRSFGYSVQPVTDFNDNGSDELGIGSPGSSKVLLYKGIRSITARVTSRLLGNLSDSDSQYTFASCVAVKLPPKPSKITTKLLVKNLLNGNNATFDGSQDAYTIDLSTGGVMKDDGETEYCRNLVIKSTSFFRVTTNVSLVDDYKVKKGFENTWVTLSAQSDLIKQVQLTCRCNDTSCAPEYVVNIERSGSNASTYLVGSSVLENVTISVYNGGSMGCNSCLMVRVGGTRVDLIQCHEDKGVYECAMPDPFRGNQTHLIDLVLRMDQLTNKDERLTIDVEVRKDCGSRGVPQKPLIVDYEFNTDAIVINGTSTNTSISEAHLDDEIKFITDEQIYSIANTESVTWKNVWANITATKKRFIQSFNISNMQGVCIESNDTEKFYAHCRITLEPHSITKLIATTTTINIKDIVNYWQDLQITIDTELSLELSPDVIMHKELKTVMMIEKEMAIGQNKMLMIIIGLVVALILLLVLGLILYKLNFFKRKNKEELQALKTEFRKRSTRRNTTASSVDGGSNRHTQRISHCDMSDLVVEEETFDNTHPEPNRTH